MYNVIKETPYSTIRTEDNDRKFIELVDVFHYLRK